MSNWLEEAERNIVTGNDQNKLEDKLQNKKEKIRKNYLDNQLAFDAFIADLKKLVDRVNHLPAENRDPFGKISFYTKESKLNNHLHYISSSARIKKRMFKNVFHFFKTYTFKRIRVVYITVSSHDGKIDIELKENMLLRVRMTRAGENERLKDPRKKNKDRKDFLFRFDLNSMNGSEPRDIIDWLAFKKEMEEILFFDGGYQVASS